MSGEPTSGGISILVVNRDCAAATLRTLDAVGSTVSPGEAELLVVDDGSEESERAPLRRPGIRLIEMPRAGILPALNRGLREAGRNDVIRLQPGILPLDPGWVQALRERARREPSAGIIGGKTLLADGRILSCGRRLVHPLGIRDHHCNLGFAEPDLGQHDAAGRLDGTLGTVAWYRRSMLESVGGGVDERFAPLWWDDDDLCLAARSQGFEVLLEPRVRAVVADAPYERPYDAAAKAVVLQRHAAYWESKWGWNPEFPDLHRIRSLWGRTAVCWRVGDGLLDDWAEDEPPVDLLLVTWNNLKRLRPCLESLARTRYPRVTLHVLDNGSTDGSAAHLAALGGGGYPLPLRLHTLPVNVGLPAAMNWLLASSDAPLVARLDDDVLLEPDWLSRMVEDLRDHPYAGVVGAKVNDLDDPGRIQCAQFRFWPAAQGHEGERDEGAHDLLLLSNHVRGCALLYRRKAIQRAGPFDIRFSPSQWDDPDHHVAIRAAGYDVLYDGRIRALHPLTSGADRSPRAVANSMANYHKLLGKWGRDVFEVLERGLDLADRAETHRAGVRVG